jgi:uncharacterized surface protein with fasciclin (FAS1) repeats
MCVSEERADGHQRFGGCGTSLRTKTQHISSALERNYAMKKSMLSLIAGAAMMVASFGSVAHAQTDPTVGGAATLVAAVKAAGLVDTLEGPGPFTVFAPTDEAFNKLPEGTVANLVKPENKATLVKILTYHVVPGKITTKEIEKMIKKGHGTATLKTVEGGTLTFTMANGGILITDEKGGTATITTANVYQSNGMIQVIDSVLMPS